MQEETSRSNKIPRERVIYITPGGRPLDSMDEDAPKNKDQAMCKSKASGFSERERRGVFAGGQNTCKMLGQ